MSTVKVGLLRVLRRNLKKESDREAPGAQDRAGPSPGGRGLPRE